MMQADFISALSELENATTRIDEAAVARACDMIHAADRIVLYGCGREGL